MAREPPVLDEDVVHTDAETDELSGNNGLLHRRSYLKLAGTSAATAAVASANPVSADEDEYDVIGGAGQIRLGDGETLENVIIDFDQGWTMLHCTGDNVTIRNVGFRGTHTADQHAIVVSGGDTVIDNVYMGDGCVRPAQYSSHGQCGIFAHRDFYGHLEIRNCNIQDWPNNGIYASAPEYDGGGTIEIDSCYAANNYVSCYRLATDGSSVSNSVAYNDGNGRYTGRAFWGWSPGTLTIENCDFQEGSYNQAIHLRDSGSIQIRDTNHTGIHGAGSWDISESNVGSNPDLSMPDGVPTSAEEAATGSSDGDSGEAPPEDDEDDDEVPSLTNTIVFDGNGTPDTTSYEFVVSEVVEPSEHEDASIDDAASVDETEASGDVADYLDAWEFDGEIERLSVDGDATVRVNGDEIDPDDYDDVFENVILLDGSEEDVTRYEFVVDGDVIPSNYEGASIDDEDEIDDGTVHGVVADWKDAFRFNGDLEQFTADGPASVYLNDEEIDPAEYGEDRPHQLLVEGRGVPTSFGITVDGTIELDSEADPEDEATTVSGSTAQSSVTDGTQEFCFSGTLSDITFSDGEAAVFLDGEEIDVSEYGDQELFANALIIDGTEADGPSTYSFKASGGVVKSDYEAASIDDEDVIEGKRVSGAVADWLDAYWFDGDIEELQVLGNAKAEIQYNARDQ
ncbi:right-handed parallel beta-helix repeat-containing protein [Halostagnicola sp. A-GB9-2]|uniref:right-handed parallel beta-helix repeat-containing protein n=1 Tax=Halostagnicola sp. A-GB9-2 TaxID=3048066 RepID=UPI0024C0DADC|nr:right-handed parallel beta-helix repeat-containing protein [Halostagnicola sp. A-GB9-2]MDJ1434505.1 right-handed parallel beta-helix repeat-containing protein [Halostagnicola sp. A-GB9-2]